MNGLLRQMKRSPAAPRKITGVREEVRNYRPRAAQGDTGTDIGPGGTLDTVPDMGLSGTWQLSAPDGTLGHGNRHQPGRDMATIGYGWDTGTREQTSAWTGHGNYRLRLGHWDTGTDIGLGGTWQLSATVGTVGH